MSPVSIHQFSEKVAVVSDAAGPVGRAVSMQLALQGSYVVGLFQNEGGSVQDLVELGTLAHAVHADLSDQTGAREAAAAVEGIFGRVDLLVNCLKFDPESTFESVTEDEFSATVRRNLGSVQFLTASLLSMMKVRPRPRIVNVVFTGGSGIFAASQLGVVALTASMADELPANFRVNCVEVRSFGKASGGTENSVGKHWAPVPPDDVARGVMFLLSSESSGMNGQVLRLG